MKKHYQPPCKKWADKLVLRPDELSPTEYAALQTHLKICPACTAQQASYQHLSARLRALPTPQTNSLLYVLPELFPGEEGLERGNHVLENTAANESVTPEIQQAEQPPSPSRKIWRQRGLALAAVLLVLLLAAPFTLLSLRSQIGNGKLKDHFAIMQGWTQFVAYQGTGSQTIDTGALPLPTVWGHSLSCQGKGKLNINLTGPGYSNFLGTDDCAATSGTITAPTTIDINYKAFQVHTIEVSAPSSMSWQLVLLQKTPPPALSLSSAWRPVAGMGGTRDNDNPMLSTLGNGLSSPEQRWAALMVCFGTGRGSIQLTPSAGTIAFPVCNGQPVLQVIDYQYAISISSIEVHFSKGSIWFVEMLACDKANSAQCQ